jgi:hypothetical protein
MTPLAEYVACVASFLGLGSWDLEIDRNDPDNSDALASIAVTFGREHATIFLGPEFDKQTPEERRVTIVHELLHACHTQVDELADNALPKAMSPESHAIFMEAYRIAVERSIDPLAVALAETIPLPPEGE